MASDQNLFERLVDVVAGTWERIGGRLDRSAQSAAAVVGAWLLAAALFVAIGQLDAILAAMHPQGGRAGGVTALTAPGTDNGTVHEILRSWDAWDAQRNTNEDLVDIDEAVKDPADVPPGTIVNWYLVVDAVFALVLAVALRLLVLRLRGRLGTGPGADPMREAVGRIVRSASWLVAIYVLADWMEGIAVAYAVHDAGPAWVLPWISRIKWLALLFAAVPLLLGALIGRRTSDERARLPSVRQTLLALRLHVIALAVVVVTLVALPGNVRPQVIDAVRAWEQEPADGVLAIAGLFGITVAFAIAAAVQLRRDRSTRRRVLMDYSVLGILGVGSALFFAGVFTGGQGIRVLGVLVLLAGLLCVPLAGTVAQRLDFAPSWVTVGTLAAAVPFAAWVAIARAGIEPTDRLVGRLVWLGVATALHAGAVVGCLVVAADVARNETLGTQPVRWPRASSRLDVATVVGGGVLVALGLAVAVHVAVAHDAREAAVVDAWGSVAIVAVAAAALLGLAVILGWLFPRPPRGAFVVLGVRRPPIVTTVLLIVGVLSLTATTPGFHKARTIKPAPAAGAPGDEAAPRDALNVDAAADAYVARQDEQHEATDDIEPLIVIATSGGGARSAYWTTLVFDCLFRSSPVEDSMCGRFGLDFDSDVFAISGISGGSVGATMYATSSWFPQSGVDPLAVWRSSVLDPILSNLLFVDAPNALWHAEGALDRAAALELAWERTQRDLGRGLYDVQMPDQGGPRYPFLVLNGATLDGKCRFNVSVLDLGVGNPLDARDEEGVATPTEKSTETERGVDSSCRSLSPYAVPAREAPTDEGAPQVETGVLESTFDLADHLCGGNDIALSTAALLSARFPVVSPSGAMEHCADGGFVYDVDGGLVDSSAASTAAALVDRLDRAGGRRSEGERDEPCRQLVVVQVDNGYEDDTPPPTDRPPGELRGYATAVGGSRADEERQALAGLAAGLPVCPASGDDVIPYVRLRPTARPGVQAPLGWLLSEDARESLSAQLTSADNQCALAGLSELLAVEPTEDASAPLCLAGTLHGGGDRRAPGRDLCIVFEADATACDGRRVQVRTDSAGTFRVRTSGSERFTILTTDTKKSVVVAQGSLGGWLTTIRASTETEANTTERDIRLLEGVVLAGWGAGSVILGVGALVVGLGSGRRRPSTAEVPRTRPMVWAHQGGARERPANTMVAFEYALDQGVGPPADGLELDVQLTADGHAVVIHDATVDGTTNGSGRVDSYTLEALQELNAGWWFVEGKGARKRAGPYPYREGDTPRIPTLVDVLDRFTTTPFIIEIKDPEVVPAVVAAVRTRLHDTVTVLTSFDQATVARIAEHSTAERRLAVAPGWLGALWFVLRAKCRLTPNPPYGALHLPVRKYAFTWISKRVVEAAHLRNIRVDAWTIDDPCEATRLFGLGVDGMMSDCPHAIARPVVPAVGAEGVD